MDEVRVNVGELVTPGTAVLDSESGFLRGHGTYVDGSSLFANVSGVIDQVNKLVTVRPLKARYTGEIGDVVVGRIVDVGHKRWRVDVNGRQDAVLPLSSINLPGGARRRRTYDDQLNIRSFYKEGDLLSAEVFQYNADGSVVLHARSLRYGKLLNGVCIQVPPALIKRSKQHFYSSPTGVNVIFGNNGYIWLSPVPFADPNSDADLHDMERESAAAAEVSVDVHLALSYFYNAITLLRNQFHFVTASAVEGIVKRAMANQIPPKRLLDSCFCSVLLEAGATSTNTNDN